MKTFVLSLAVVLAAASAGYAQPAAFDRLPPDVLDVRPPSARVEGLPGLMTIVPGPCPTVPSDQVRRRIVDLATQEWGFFGFTVVDRTQIDDDDEEPRRRRRRLPPEARARVADSIAGYWTVAPGGDWIIERQNEIWNGPRGVGERWRFPWSAAFVSWVMCESGLGTTDQFARAIAHHVYIDQAIRARDGRLDGAAFAAYDVGEAIIRPGDLLCSARRPAYRSLAERRRQMGEGARTHCDIVVKVDEAASRILAIGGNVRGTVSLKILPATLEEGRLAPAQSQARRSRAPFAHLQLRAEPIDANALDTSPTIKAIGCAILTTDSWRAAADLMAIGTLGCSE